MCLFSEIVTDSSDKITASFHSCYSFGWLPPFVFKGFLFKHNTVIKSPEQLMEFSVDEIPQVLPADHREGPEKQKHAFGCVGSCRPGCPGGSSVPPGVVSLIISPLFAPFIETSPACSRTHPQKRGQNQRYSLAHKANQLFTCIYHLPGYALNIQILATFDTQSLNK